MQVCHRCQLTALRGLLMQFSGPKLSSAVLARPAVISYVHVFELMLNCE